MLAAAPDKASYFNKKVIHAISPQLDRLPFERAGYGKKDDVDLAARLFHHDSMQSHNILVQLVDYFLNHPEKINDAERMNNSFRSLVTARLLGITSAYLASGANEKYLYGIPASQLEFLLGKISRYKSNFSIFPEGCILNPEFSALYQITKDACGNFLITIENNGPYKVLRFLDDGPGIRDREKQSLPQERLHEIFDEFSSRQGGGLGLQVARALMSLRGGHIEVTTRTEGNQPIAASTFHGEIIPYNIETPTGTSFAIYIPK